MTSEASQMGLASGDGLGRKSLRIHVAKSSLHVDDKMPVVILGAGSGRYRVWNGIPDFKEFRQWLMRTEETNRSNEGHDLCVVGKDNKLLSTCPTGTDAVPNGSQSNAFSSGLVPQPTKQKVDSFQSDSGITIQVPGVRFIEPAEQIAHANQKDHLVRLSSSTYIRFNQPSAAELYVAVEYDMDEEDDAWLAAFNKSCNGELLTEDDLELLIDRMEKQYFRELCAMGKPAIQAAKAGALAPSKVLPLDHVIPCMPNRLHVAAAAVHGYWLSKTCRGTPILAESGVVQPLLPRLRSELVPLLLDGLPAATAAATDLPFIGRDKSRPGQPLLGATETFANLRAQRDDIEVMRILIDQVKRREKLKRQITRMWVAKLRAQMAGAQAASKHALAEKAAAEAATIGRRLRSRLNCAVGPGGTSVQAAPHLRPKSKVRQAQSQAPAKQAKRVSDARLPSSSQITTEATQGAPLHETVAHSRAKSRLLVGPDEVHSICAQGSSRVQNGPATFGSAAEPNSVIYAKLNGIISLSPGTDPAGIDEPPSMVSYTEQQTCRWCSQTAKCVVCRDCGACYCYQCFRSTKGLGVQGWALSIRQKRFSCKGFQGLEIKQPPCNNADSNGVISISSLQQNAGGEDKMASASDVKRGSADDNNTIARRTRSAAKGQSTPMKLRLARRTSGAPARASGREFERRAADEPPSCELLHDPPLPKRRCVEASASPSEGQSTLSAQGDSRWTIAARIRWGRYRKSPASNLRSCK